MLKINNYERLSQLIHIMMRAINPIKMRKILNALLIPILISTSLLSPTTAIAAGTHLVINEVAWAGSADSSTDEWIELYNPTNSTIDLTDWTISDDGGASIYSLSGSIGPAEYFLIEDSEAATSVASDLIISNISLANTGDRLELKDPGSITVDDVNPSGGAWPAGDSAGNISMERNDSAADADLASSWGDSSASGPSTASAGSLVSGTPRAMNSIDVSATAEIYLFTANPIVVPGNTLTLSVMASAAENLYAYGFDVNYDPSQISFDSAAEAAFLVGALPYETAFEAGLVDGSEGILRIAGSRLGSSPGESGGGELASITFTVSPTATGSIDLGISPDAFTATPIADSVTGFTGINLSVGSAVDPVLNLAATEGAARYSIDLAWDAPTTGADSYEIYRRDASGAMVEIGTSVTAGFTDDDSTSLGGAIIPTRTYEYEVIAILGADSSDPATTSGSDNRGLVGDSNRDDTTGGRDLTELARSWGLNSADADFNRLTDTTIDGSIDADDLLNLATNWALTYTP